MSFHGPGKSFGSLVIAEKYVYFFLGIINISAFDILFYKAYKYKIYEKIVKIRWVIISKKMLILKCKKKLYTSILNNLKNGKSLDICFYD